MSDGRADTIKTLKRQRNVIAEVRLRIVQELTRTWLNVMDGALVKPTMIEMLQVERSLQRRCQYRSEYRDPDRSCWVTFNSSQIDQAGTWSRTLSSSAICSGNMTLHECFALHPPRHVQQMPSDKSCASLRGFGLSVDKEQFFSTALSVPLVALRISP